MDPRDPLFTSIIMGDARVDPATAEELYGRPSFRNLGARGTAPVHLWILGAADLCDQVLPVPQPAAKVPTEAEASAPNRGGGRPHPRAGRAVTASMWRREGRVAHLLRGTYGRLGLASANASRQVLPWPCTEQRLPRSKFPTV